jgi:broad specificity phosphatase PhoE
MITRLALLAHGATPAQRRLSFPGDESIEPLAPAVAYRVQERIGTFELAWRGPERRAAETSESLGVSASPIAGLRAWSMGTWSGQRVVDIAEHEPVGFASWRTDPQAAPHGGESLNDLLDRVRSWLQQCETVATRTLVVTDPAVIRAALVCALDAGVSTFWRVDIAPLSLTTLQHTNSEWRVRSMGLDLGE